MNQHIVEILPVEKYFSITWELGRRCNYDCMYCPTYLHDNFSKHKTLAELKKSWISLFEQTKVRNLKYKISFTGGEVTGSRAFYPFVEWLRSNYQEHIGLLIVTTNGSATYSYYQKLYQLVDNIAFSFHSEHANEQKFFDTVIGLKKIIGSNKFIHVSLMNEYWNVERIAHYKQLLDEHSISYNVNEIDYSKKNRSYPIMKGKLNLAFNKP